MHAVETPSRPVQARPGLAGMGLHDLQGIMADAADLQRLRALEARLKYHVVSVPEGEVGTVTVFDKLEEVVAHVQPLLGSRGQLLIFLGDRFHTTKGALKFIVPPLGMGERIPLFQNASDLEVDPTGDTGLYANDVEDALPIERT